MEQVQQQVEQAIVEKSDAISLEGDQTAEQKFCELWPQVQTGLVLLQAIIKNPIVKFVVTIIIGAGNGVSSNICGEETAK